MTRSSDTHDLHASTNDHLYGAFDYDDQFVIYDVDNADCWLKSDTAVELADAV